MILTLEELGRVLWGILLVAVLLTPIGIWIMHPDILMTCKVFEGLERSDAVRAGLETGACLIREAWPISIWLFFGFYAISAIIMGVAPLLRHKKGKEHAHS